MNIYTLLIILSLVMVMMGGWSDMTGKKFIVSKKHYWNDAMYLLVLAIAIKVIYNY